MDEDWARRVGAAEPGGVRQGGQSPAAREANGTGPFRVVERQADVATAAERNAG